jgi:hypothetical protein
MQPGMFAAFFQHGEHGFGIGHLLRDPTIPEHRLRASALMLERGESPLLLPAADTKLKPGDRILFVGTSLARRLQGRYLSEPGTVSWVLTGQEPPRSYLFRWWQQRVRSRAG